MRVSKPYDAADTSATPGRVFTGSIGLEEIVPFGVNLNHLMIGWKGAVSTAAVAIEAAVAQFSAYTLNVGQETRILANLRQLCALMHFYYGELPFIWENTDNTGNDFVGGVKVPVYAPIETGKPITHSADRTAVTNIGTETLAINAHFSEQAAPQKAIHAVRRDHTTAAATGIEALTGKIPPVGKLIGLIVQMPAVFTDANIDTSIQRIHLNADGKRHSSFNMLSQAYAWAGRSVGVLDPMDDLMNVFTYIDLREEGIDAKANELTLDLDIQDASDAVTFIPVLEIQ